MLSVGILLGLQFIFGGYGFLFSVWMWLLLDDFVALLCGALELYASSTTTSFSSSSGCFFIIASASKADNSSIFFMASASRNLNSSFSWVRLCSAFSLSSNRSFSCEFSYVASCTDLLASATAASV
ncbi:Os05g0119850 [Oryza sativa Japonica Group]|uniref:Os05g0119850 protein n=1 Tax=Oryza sativa subsp. japonica TaxID=39947 RepID=A0A0P0WHB2_ORYSJ|nr:hypothetical protein EE612_026733 [Oryza sativa]BAS92005.1 Os05g0119850 [Oryza sativa Japonica Group]